MQDQSSMNTNDAPQGPQDQPDAPGSPIDNIISTVDGYIQDPKTITPETLAQLKMDLEDLKTVLDGEEHGEPSGPPAPPSQGGLAGMIGGR